MDEMLHHNLPPDMAITAGEVTGDLSNWLSEHPIISDEDMAREAKVYLDRAKLCIADLEAERTGKVKPLNDEVAAINSHYKTPRELLRRILDELGNRLSAFMLKEEEARLAIAQAARSKAEELERIAREAEERERDAYSEASQGALGINLSDITSEADQTFHQFERAAHRAALAEREAKVRIGGGFSRALGLKNKEELVITDAILVIGDIGWTEDIRAAIIKGARAYRKLHNKLPAGIESIVERKA